MAEEDAEGSPNALYVACTSRLRSFAVLRRQGRLRENREQRGRLRQAQDDTSHFAIAEGTHGMTAWKYEAERIGLGERQFNHRDAEDTEAPL